uniref:Cytochrome c oxidase assembly protein COX20, mitochondrial n=1 Tax=Timema shepardi TaxID=629360 RepID=A0A7R9AT06_TIMSH|nr:unnamed protein product [Timema shepardi]
MSEEEEETKRKLILFGRDVSEIPCFRNSYLYGISSGIGMGLTYFMFTSKVRMATHVGFGSFLGVTMVYWLYSACTQRICPQDGAARIDDRDSCFHDRPRALLVLGLYSGRAQHRPCIRALDFSPTLLSSNLIHCRYKYSLNKFNMGQLQAAMKKKAMYEGTERAEKIEKNLKDA